MKNFFVSLKGIRSPDEYVFDGIKLNQYCLYMRRWALNLEFDSKSLKNKKKIQENFRWKIKTRKLEGKIEKIRDKEKANTVKEEKFGESRRKRKAR